MQRVSATATLILGIGASLFAFWFLRRPPTPQPEGPGKPPFALPVTLATPQRGDLTPSLHLTGNVRAVERARLGFQLAGRIHELLARDGDRVEAGQVLARLDPRDAHQSVAQAQAELELAQAEMLKLEAGERAEVVAELAADVASAEAELALAQLEVERTGGLLESRISSQSAYDRLAAERDATQGRANAARERLATAQAGSRVEDIAIERARVASRQADLKRAELDLAKTELVSPFAARVVAKHRSVGDYVQVGEEVFDLFDPSQLEVELFVPSAAAGALRIGANVVMRVGGQEGPPLDAVLAAISPAADDTSRNVRAIVRVDGDDPAFEALRPGAFVRAEMALATIEGAWIVPGDAILVNDGGEFVVRAAPNPPPETTQPGPPPPPWSAQWVPVRILGRDGQKAAIETKEGELRPADQLVVTGVDRAFPMTPLMPAAVMPAPNGAPR